MKDTIVTARRKKTELITLLICFVVSNLLHLYAIIAYHAPFTEMITSIFYIIIFTFVLYVNPEKPDVPLNKNDAFQKVQKRHVQEKR